MHKNSQLLFAKYASNFFRPGMRVLEIGPDKFPSTFQAIMKDKSLTWDTLDLYESEKLTYCSKSQYSFPIADNAYDIILSAQVLEHVRKIWLWTKELSRICKVGGVVITINPVSWPYHEAPVDCWRVYPEGMRALYEDASLEVIESKWESLEARGYRNHIPGRSPQWQPSLLRATYRALGLLGLPVECAYDTITIGRKIDPITPQSSSNE
jgi:SAM-dependent methyltransferase